MAPGDFPAPQENLPAASELRIGLAMSGGIALVLYMAGVAHEMLRFLRAWDKRGVPGENGYGEAFSLVPIRPVIDILTGASAGGINSVLMGNCIATGKSFDEFRKTWVELAGIRELRHKTSRPRSLLSTAPLVADLRGKLRQNIQAVNGQPHPDAPDLFVRLCRTHLRGHCLSTQDAIGHRIDVENKANVIGFRTENFLQGDSRSLDKIIDAARATSAFPGAFEPVYDSKERRWYVDGGLWNNQPIDLAVEAIKDKPAFARTHRCLFFIEPNPAIATPAEPETPQNPPSLGANLAGIPMMGLKGTIWPAIESILEYNQRSNLYQNLLDSLEPNSALETCLTRHLGCDQLEESRKQRAEVAEAVAFDAALRNAAETAPALFRENPERCIPILLNQIRIHQLLFDDDPALIQRWNSLLERLGYAPQRPEGERVSQAACCALAAALSALDAVRLSPEAWLEQYDRGADRSGSGVEPDLLLRALRRQLDSVNAKLVAEYERQKPETERISLAVQRPMAETENFALFRQEQQAPVQQQKVEARREIGPQKALLYGWIEQVNAFLYNSPQEDQGEEEPVSIEEESAHYLRDTRFGQSRFRAASVRMLQEMEAGLQRIETPPAARPRQAARSASEPIEEERRERGFQAMLQALQEMSEAEAESARTGAILFLARWKMGDWVREAQGVVASLKPSNAPVLHVENLYLRHLAAIGEEPPSREAVQIQMFRQTESAPEIECLDALRHILAALSDLEGRKPVDLVRISPNDTNNLHLVTDEPRGQGTPAAQKLAGEGLGHFTGFFETRWRRNDYIWGRLDACEILLRALQKYGAREGYLLTPEKYAECLQAEQERILQDEAQVATRWHKNQKLPTQPVPDLSCCGGLPRNPAAATGTTGNCPDRRQVQEANCRLIGYGQETLLDADEPRFTDNVNYIVNTSIRMAQGDADRPPPLLDRASRALRVFSYPMRVMAALTPTRRPPPARLALGLMAVIIVVGLLGFFIGGYSGDRGDLVKNLGFALYGAVVILSLLVCGSLLGWKWIGPLWLLTLTLCLACLHFAGALTVGGGWPFLHLESRLASAPANLFLIAIASLILLSGAALAILAVAHWIAAPFRAWRQQ